MLRSQEWTDWLYAKTRCIWIYGIPGAEKTILASHLIEAIKDHLKAATLEKFWLCLLILLFHKQAKRGSTILEMDN